MKLRVFVDQNRLFLSSDTFIKLLTYLKFEPVNTFMHNCNIFYIIIYANVASYYVNQTCDEIEIGIVGKWKFAYERTTPIKIDTFQPNDNAF